MITNQTVYPDVQSDGCGETFESDVSIEINRNYDSLDIKYFCPEEREHFRMPTFLKKKYRVLPSS